MSSFRIKGWETFQHFKDRRPPWIKLYRDLLDDPEWHFLDEKSAKVLIMLWLVASDDKTGKGLLPDLHHLSFRLRMDEPTLTDCISKLSHWVVSDDIAVMSERYRDDAPEKRREEIETETKEEEVEIEPPHSPQPENCIELFPGEPKSPAPIEVFRESWNVMAEKHGLPQCRQMTDKRKVAFKARWKDPGWRRDYAEAISKVPASEFLLGNNGRGWKADIDWFLSPDSVTKILEQKYDGNRKRVGETHDDDDYQPF